jgi:hypothetical protein
MLLHKLLEHLSPLLGARRAVPLAPDDDPVGIHGHLRRADENAVVRIEVRGRLCRRPDVPPAFSERLYLRQGLERIDADGYKGYALAVVRVDLLQ